MCLNFEDNDTKRQARLWNQVSQRELENLWNQIEKEKEKKKREREENERAGKLLESNGSKEEKKKRVRSFWNQVEVKKKKKERMY